MNTKNKIVLFLMFVFIVGLSSCRGKSGCALLYLLMQNKNQPVLIRGNAPGTSKVTFSNTGSYDLKLDPKYGSISVDVRSSNGKFNERVFTNVSYKRESSIYINEIGDYTVSVSGMGNFSLEIR